MAGQQEGDKTGSAGPKAEFWFFCLSALLCSWIAFATASACGGRDASPPRASSEQVGSNPAPPSPARPPAPSRELCERPETAAPAALADALVQRVNQARAAGAECGAFGKLAPAAPLRSSPALTCMARLHGEDMVARGFFSHVNPDGAGAEARARVVGFARASAENLAWGQETPEQVVASWLRSPDHCKTMLDPRWSLTGAAHRRTTAGRTFWTQTFGAE